MKIKLKINHLALKTLIIKFMKTEMEHIDFFLMIKSQYVLIVYT
jgi:hypothetical protein